MSRTLALLICAGFALLALAYAAVTPPFEAPDEGSHFLYIHNFLESGELPILEDRDTVFASQSVQRHHSPLYYLVGAVLISWTQRDDVEAYLEQNPLAAIGFVSDHNQNVYLHPVPAPAGDTGVAIWVLRLYSIALAVMTLWFVYRAGTLAASDARVGLVAALLVASIPSFLHISASINNDNLVTMLFAAGVYLCLRLWTEQRISLRLALALSIVAGCIALTKTNGLALLGVIAGTLVIGALVKRWSWRAALAALAGTLAGIALIAGWWYVRNLQLYGDPLALQATLRIWARGGPPQLISLFELKGVWDSFWDVLGHLSIRGPEWLLSLYLPLVTLLALAGIGVTWWRRPDLRLRLVFLVVVCLLVIAALLAASSRMNVSQGRILFPGLVAFAPLLVIGWRQWLGRWAGVLILPLSVLALLAPMATLPTAFAGPQLRDSVPGDARRIDVHSDDLTLLAYTLDADPLQSGDWLRLTLYIQGVDSRRPLLFVKALDPLTQDVYGGVDTYPAMMPTDQLAPDVVYAVPVRFRVHAPDAGPLRLDLALGWRVPDADDPGEGDYLPLVDANGAALNTLLVAGPTLLNPKQAVATPDDPAEVVYGDVIRLNGTTLSAETLAPGETLTVTLYWESVAPTPEDWTVTVGLLDPQNQLIAQDDGMPPGYPTSAWIPGSRFTDTRSLTLPDDAAPGDYRLYVAWYRLADFTRLQPVGTDVSGDVYLHPTAIQVKQQ